MSYILISHDLAVVRQLTEEVVVLYRGQVVERGPTPRVLDDPQEEYTKRLRASVPRPGWKPAAGRGPARRHSTGGERAVSDLHYLSATEALRLFRSRELSPVELMTAVIARAEAVEPAINAFAETRFDEAMDAARAAQERYAGTGDPPGPLDGLPVAVKEEAPIAGQQNTLGSLPLRDVVADHTAAFVQRIIDAGGIVHARSATPEFCCAPFTWTKLWGVSRNPWNTAFSPGGSSGGSAASLAAGSATLATGSDIGGSIRIPSSFCGVTGFKPPYGRVPEMEIFNLDHYCHEGPLARSWPTARCWRTSSPGRTRATWPRSARSWRSRSRLEPVTGMRIALSVDLGCYAVDDDVAANTRAAADRLRDAGATVQEVSLPWQLETINRAARIHFGMIFGPSVRDIYEKHARRAHHVRAALHHRVRRDHQGRLGGRPGPRGRDLRPARRAARGVRRADLPDVRGSRAARRVRHRPAGCR